MFKKNDSITKIVITTLIAVSTVILIVFGLITIYGEYQILMKRLHKELEVSTKQSLFNLSGPF